MLSSLIIAPGWRATVVSEKNRTNVYLITNADSVRAADAIDEKRILLAMKENTTDLQPIGESYYNELLLQAVAVIKHGGGIINLLSSEMNNPIK